MKIVLTGASGFLGGAVARRFVERGHGVRALVRESSDTSRLDGCELAVADLSTGAGVAAACRGVDLVVHAAGGGKVKGARDYDAQNVETTRVLLDNSPGTPMVLVSSLAAAGPGHPVTRAQSSPVSLYGKSKAKAEKLLLASVRSARILRPPSVYGPHDTRFLPMFKAIARGFCVLPPGERLSLIYVDDCAEAILRAAEQPMASKELPLYTCDGRAYAWRELALQMASSLGVDPPRLVRTPSSVLLGIAAGSELIAKARNRATALNRDKWRDGRVAAMVSNNADTRWLLDWHPRTDLAAGMATTARFYKDEGWL